MRRLGLFLTLLTLGCNERAAAPAPHPETLPRLDETGPSERTRRGIDLAFRWRQVYGRLSEPMPRPEAFKSQACHDDRIRTEGMTPEARTLTLDFDDARYGARSLMPLIMTKSLKSPHVEALEALLEAPTTAQSPSFEFSSKDAADSAERLLVDWDQRAYKGVFFVVQYKKPHLVRKKGKRRREWLPGLLHSWLVVYDIDTSEALCSTRVMVQSDVEGEPVWLRTKAHTQHKLIRELGQAMLQEGRNALASLSSQLIIEQANEPARLASNQARSKQE